MILNIIIDNSGYHLQNLGDVAMLQGAVKRIRKVVPSCSLSIISSDKDAQSRLIPDSNHISAKIPNLAHQHRLFPIPHQLVPSVFRRYVEEFERAHRVTHCHRLLAKMRNSNDPSAAQWLNQLSQATAVIATGGGYLTDNFQQHASRLLTNLALAQTLGKPTAIFSQGLGPITNKRLRQITRSVLKNTCQIGLREFVTGPQHLKEMQIVENGQPTIEITGDDALEILPRNSKITQPSEQSRIGLCLRLTSYSGIDRSTLSFLRSELQTIAKKATRPVEFCPLPIDLLNPEENDETHAFEILQGLPITENYRSPTQPIDVINLASACSSTITGSYHCALFSIAQGIPVVAVQSNAYYSGKFAGIKTMFPKSVTLYDPIESSEGDLLKCLIAANNTPKEDRQKWVEITAEYRLKGQQFYQQFLDLLDPTKN